MCLAIPVRIVELDGDNAVVSAMGNRFRAKTNLLPNVKLGRLVLVHAGFAISLVDEEDAKTVPCNIEQHFFREARITGYRLTKAA